jgi:hypothetical protein
VLCLSAAFAASASGETATIGAVELSGKTASVSCLGGGACTSTYVQLTQPTPGVFLEAPADGVITSWRVHGDSGGTGSLALRVLHDEDGGGGQLTAVGTSPPVSATETDGSPAHPVSMPVFAGDYIGVNVLHPAIVFYTVPGGAIFGKWEEGFPEGTKVGPANTLSGRLMLNAVESLKPTVSGVSPATGPTAGGGTVTISGSSLDGATSVYFGGVPALSFTPAAQGITSEFMTATVPAGVAGAVHVQVTGPGGASYATSADLYSYIVPVTPRPSVPIASPPSGTPPGPLSAGLSSAVGAGLAGEPPVIGNVSETVKRWRERKAVARVGAKKKMPVGTTFSFTLNGAATVGLRFTRQAAARQVHSRCVAPSMSNRNKPRCLRRIAAGALAFAGHPGINKIRFLGHITPAKGLAPGDYVLTLTATDTQGRHSAPRSLAFTIVR